MSLEGAFDKLRQANAEWTLADVKGFMGHSEPRTPISEGARAVVERLGLPTQYLQLLDLCDGWDFFYQDCVLFGSQEFLGNSVSKLAVDARDILAAQGVIPAEPALRPVAMSVNDLDIFLIDGSVHKDVARVYWFAGQPVEQFVSVAAWLDAMAGYVRATMDRLARR